MTFVQFLGLMLAVSGVNLLGVGASIWSGGKMVGGVNAALVTSNRRHDDRERDDRERRHETTELARIMERVLAQIADLERRAGHTDTRLDRLEQA